LDRGGMVGDQLDGMSREERGEVSVGWEKNVGSPTQPTSLGFTVFRSFGGKLPSFLP
jgi:hypothetical protein